MKHDVLIVGAGPAGSATARRLAAAGMRVALVSLPAHAGWEGLSARSAALLGAEGVAPEVVLDGPYARSGVWAGRPVEGIEWLVERRALAAALRAAALATGVQYWQDGVTHVTRRAGGWRCELKGGGVLEAPLLVEARGRRGAECRGALLLALGQPYRTASPAALPGTQIHALEQGWCWFAHSGRSLWVQVVGSPRGESPRDTVSAASWIARAAAELPPLRALLAVATNEGPAVARPAHVRLGRGYGDEGGDAGLGRFFVGDTAFALDPLSGQGVYEALRGAQLVATAVLAVHGGGDAALTQRFVVERQIEAARNGMRVAAAFYRENAARGAFWSRTAAAYAAAADGAAMADEAVARGVAPAPRHSPVAPYVARRPVLADGRIVERDVIVTAQRPRGVWHVAGVPVVPLKGYLEAVPQATVAGAAEVLHRPQADVASAILWLQQTGLAARGGLHSW